METNEFNLKPGDLINFPHDNPKRNQKPIVGVVDENGCVNCISHKTKDGVYPRFKNNYRDWLIHRYIFSKYCESIPEGEVVRHKCDNPKCINPDHLERGTVADNNYDKLVRGRQYSKLTHEEAEYIKFHATESVNELAKKYNVSETTIKAIKEGKSWKHIKESIKVAS